MGQDYYSGFAEYYHLHLEVTGREDIGFFTNLARGAGGPVFEVGCGTGRTLVPSAAAGAAITGMDISRDMLRYCRKLLRKEPADTAERVELVHGDMTSFDLGKKFSLITAPFRSFQHLATVEEQLSALASIRKHLAPGGVFVLDIFDPDLDILTDSGRAVEFGDEEPFSAGHGRTVTVSYRNPSVDTVSQIVHCEMIFSVEHSNGKRERFIQEFIMRYIFRYEAEHLLYRSGFAVESLSGGYNGEPVGAGELVFTAVPL